MRYTILHSPNFADYRGDHDSIIIPRRSIAAVDIPAEVVAAGKTAALNHAYRYSQHGVAVKWEPWYLNEGVMLHVRSTSPGDIFADEEGIFWVVENAGFSVIEKEALLNKCQCCGRPFAPERSSETPLVEPNG